ncbi:MAG: S8 family serine peptidase, partial [Candidatus Nanoarchaeia archaeon]
MISKKLSPGMRRKNKQLLATVLLVLFAFAGLTVFFFKEGDLTGRAVGDNEYGYFLVNKMYSENSEILFSKNVTSFRVTGSFSGNGSAKIYLNSSGNLILVYEVSVPEDNGDMLATGFVTYGDEIPVDAVPEEMPEGEIVQEEIVPETVPEAPAEENQNEIINEIIQEEIVGEEIVQEVIPDDNASEESAEEIIVEELFVEDVSENISENISEEEFNATEEIFNTSEEIINFTEINISENETIIVEDVVENESEGEEVVVGDDVIGEQLNESIEDFVNESYNESIVEENLSQEFVFELECMESCSLMPTQVDGVIVEIVSGELKINEFVFTSPDIVLQQIGNIENVSLTMGVPYFLNVAEYFEGRPEFYDFSSSQGYTYYVDGPIVVLTPQTEGVWPARVYAAKGGVVINSNDFFVIISNNSAVNETINATVNETLNVSINETMINESIPVAGLVLLLDENNMSSLLGNLSFVIDEELLMLLENSSSEVRVIVKYNEDVSSAKGKLEDLKALKIAESEAGLDSSELKSEFSKRVEVLENLSGKLEQKKEEKRILEKDKKESGEKEQQISENKEKNNENTVEFNELFNESDLTSDNLSENTSDNISMNVPEEVIGSISEEVVQKQIPEPLIDEVISSLDSEIIAAEDELNSIAEQHNAQLLSEIIMNSSIMETERALDSDSEAVIVGVPELLALNEAGVVEGVYLDRPVSLLVEESLDLIMFEEARNYALNNLSLVLDGSGSRICLVDTGVNPSVVDNYAFGFDVVNNDSDPADDNGHGTSVGYILSRVSLGSEVVAVKVLNSSGEGYQSDVIAGLEYCAAQNVDIISLSIGAGAYACFCENDLVAQKVNELAALGIFVVAATGNDASGLIKSPACASGALAVAASTKQ